MSTNGGKEQRKKINPLLGIVIGVAVGIALGVALGNIAVAVGVGAGVGVLFALGLRQRNERQDGSDGRGSDSAQ